MPGRVSKGGKKQSRGRLHGKRGHQWGNHDLDNDLDFYPWSFNTFIEHLLFPGISCFS